MANGNTLLLIICLLVILIVTLGINYLAHQKEQERLRRRQLTKLLQREIEQVLEAMAALKAVECPAAIREQLGNYCAELIAQLADFNPQSGIVDQLKSQKDAGGSRESPENLTQPGAIQRVQAGIRHALKVLTQLQRKGRLTPGALNEYRNELLLLHCQVEADAYIEKAKRFAAHQKNALAMSHLRHAKLTVTRLPTRDPRKQEKLNIINNLLDEVNPFKTTAPAPEVTSSEEPAS